MNYCSYLNSFLYTGVNTRMELAPYHYDPDVAPARPNCTCLSHPIKGVACTQK